MSPNDEARSQVTIQFTGHLLPWFAENLPCWLGDYDLVIDDKAMIRMHGDADAAFIVEVPHAHEQ